MIGAILGLASTLLGQGKAAEQTTPGFHSSGFSGDSNGVTKGPAMPDPIKEDIPDLEPIDKGPITENPGPIDRVNGFLDKPLGKLAQGVAGAGMQYGLNRRSSRKQFEYLKSQGLTPWEIGGGGAGSGYASNGNTLGSGPANQLKTQQQFQAEQAQLERDNKLAIAQVQSAPSYGQLDIAKQKLAMEQTMLPYEIKKVEATYQNAMQDLTRKKFDLEVYWPTKYATMSPQNAMFSLATVWHGVDMNKVLMGLPMSSQERESMRALVADFLRWQSTIGSTYHGFSESVRNFVEQQNEVLTEPGKTIGNTKKDLTLTPESERWIKNHYGPTGSPSTGGLLGKMRRMWDHNEQH